MWLVRNFLIGIIRGLKCWNAGIIQQIKLPPHFKAAFTAFETLPLDSNTKRSCTIVTSKHKPLATLKSSRIESHKAILATYVACAGLLNWHKTKSGTLEICDNLTNSQKILFSHLGNRKTHVLISAHQTEESFPAAPHTTKLHNLDFLKMIKIPVGPGTLAGEWRLRQEEGAIAKTRWRHSCRLRCPPPLFPPKCSFLNALLLASLPPARWNALPWLWDQQNWWW